MPRLFAWVRDNQSHLLTLLFIVGFIVDVITFTLLDLPAVNLLFLGYLGIATALMLLTHRFARFADHPSRWRRAIAVFAPLGTAFIIGGLLSGCLIFYTKSADVFVAWPFLLMLAGVFLGNEFFRSRRSHLIFQTILFFFALYAYLIFALPLYVDRLGPRVFLESTSLAAGIFAVFLLILAFSTGARQLARTLPQIVFGAVLIVGLVVLLYFSGLVPPIPLTLKEGGVYHHVVRTPEGYRITYEGAVRWSRFIERTVHHTPGQPLYAYGAVFAPPAFSANVVHRWERYDEAQKKWVTESAIAFALSGGRAGGYRGYSEKSDPRPGKWRVSIETVEGQVIGRMRFNVENVPVPPKLYTQVR